MKRTFLGKIDTYANWKYLFLVSLFFSPALLVNGQTNGELKAEPAHTTVLGIQLPEYISALSVIVAILAALVAIAILVPAIVSMVQLNRFAKDMADFRNQKREVIEEAKKQIMELEITVKNRIQEHKPAPEILKEAKETTHKACGDVFEALKHHIDGLKEDIEKRQKNLEDSMEKGKSSYDEIKAILNRIDSDIEKKPIKSEIIVEVNDMITELEKKYKNAEDLKKILLGAVESAFNCLHNLSNDERKEIRRVLSTNPIPINDDKK